MSFDAKTIQEIVVHDCYNIRSLEGIKTVIDIGANIGVFSVFAKTMFPAARVIAIEACKETCTELALNTGAYGVEIYNVALGIGRVKVNRFLASGCFYTSVADDGDVQAYTLTNLINMLKVDKAGLLLKVDIEGAEKYIEVAEVTDIRAWRIEGHAEHSKSPTMSVEEWDAWLDKFRNSTSNTYVGRTKASAIIVSSPGGDSCSLNHFQMYGGCL